MSTTYEYNRVCKCGHTDTTQVSERDAAFGLREQEIWQTPCSRCGATDFSVLSHPHPPFTRELLLEWEQQPDFRFMEQDEALILAEEENIDLILEALDNHDLPAPKQRILVEALCVIIYDNAVEDDQNPNLVARVAAELRQRKPLVLDAREWIMPYITEVAFPIIGVEE